MSFIADPILLVGAGVALERLAPDEVAASRAERALLATFLALSVPVYLDASWTRPIWRTFRARSGRDFMLNSGVFHFDYEDPPVRTHIAAAAIFATYPLWLHLGRRLGARSAHGSAITDDVSGESRPSAIEHLAHAVARTRCARAVLGQGAFSRLDRRVLGATQGRFGLASPGRLPTLLLTTTGHRSGEPRSVAVMYVRDGNDCIVVGSNWGRARHPAWSDNLLARPQASVVSRSGHVDVEARLCDAEERARRWPALVRAMPLWDDYQKIAGRELRVFVLEPRESSAKEGPWRQSSTSRE